MMKLSKILLPVDFSERGLGAARYAGALARHFEAELTLLHVNAFSVAALAAPAEFSGPIDIGWVTALEAQRRKELDSYQKNEFRDVKLQRAVATGDPAARIVEHAHREHVGLIVMPTHGYGPFRRFLLGSVTAKVLSDVECPVWTGAHMEDTTHHQWKVMNHVLCAVDGGPASERVLDWAWRFAEEFNSLFTVVHAIPRLEAPEHVIDPNWRSERIASVEAQLRCLQSKVGARGDVLVEEGAPAKVVAAAAAKRKADLVVIGRSPKEGFLGRLRPNAYAIISESPCPVVSV
jgi:nucleotide-binding universal stress UspA family protein